MKEDVLMKQVMDSKMEGKRGSGRKRIGVIDDLFEKVSHENLKRDADNRQEWRAWLPETCRMT